MADFQIDEIVDITIVGARVVNTFPTSYMGDDTGTVLAFRTCDHLSCKAGTVNIGDPGVTVERLTPVEWPPRNGDVWRDRTGDLWFAVDDGELTHSGYVAEASEHIAETFGPLTLVYREDQPNPEQVPYLVTFEQFRPTANHRVDPLTLHAVDAEDLADKILAHFDLPRGRYGVAVDLEQGGGEISDGLAPYITFTVKPVGGDRS